MGTDSWIIHVDSKYNYKCPYKREVEGGFTIENEGNMMTEARRHIVLKMEERDMSQGIQET